MTTLHTSAAHEVTMDEEAFTCFVVQVEQGNALDR